MDRSDKRAFIDAFTRKLDLDRTNAEARVLEFGSDIVLPTPAVTVERLGSFTGVASYRQRER